jgi:hypothetical protein
VTGTTTYTGTVSGIPIGEATQAALDLKANINNPTFVGTVEMNNLDISNAMKCNTVSAYNTGKVTVTDTLSVSGFIEADTICSRIADKVTVNDNLEVIGDLVASGAFLVDTMRTSEANLISIDDNVTINGALVVGTAAANKNLTVNGTLNVLGLSYKPWHVAGRVDGATLQILSNKGEYPFTVTRPSSYPVGIFLINWTQAHPDGANYVACCSGEGGGWNDLVNGVGAGFPTASGMVMNVAFRKLWQGGQVAQSEGLIDCTFSFFILK